MQRKKIGCKVIAVSDSTGGIYCPDGLNPPDVLAHKEKTGSVQNYKGCKNITNEELLELQCDVLIPAALENQITCKNADKIKAKMVAEAANGPTTPEADKILYEKEICLIPDILANSGGVTVSYFEWVQNLTREQWPLEKVNRKLEEKMTKAFNDVVGDCGEGRERHAHRRLNAGCRKSSECHKNTRTLAINTVNLSHSSSQHNASLALFF